MAQYKPCELGEKLEQPIPNQARKREGVETIPDECKGVGSSDPKRMASAMKMI
jgi:hypothetical protein